MVSGSFETYHMLTLGVPAIILLPGVFIALIAVLTLKLRKSPFDISTSHHAHQELNVCDFVPFRQKSCQSRDRPLV